MGWAVDIHSFASWLQLVPLQALIVCFDVVPTRLATTISLITISRMAAKAKEEISLFRH